MKKSVAASGRSQANRAVSLLLAMTLALGLTPAAAFAEAEETLKPSEPVMTDSLENAAPEGQAGDDVGAGGEGIDVSNDDEEANPTDMLTSAGAETGAVEDPIEALNGEEAVVNGPQVQSEEGAGLEGGSAVYAAAEEGEWIAWGECEYSIDAHGNVTVRPADGVSGVLGDDPELSNTTITSVVFEDGVALPETLHGFFAGCQYLQSVDFSRADTSRVTSMRRMFEGCWALTSPGLSGFDTSSVIDMGRLFAGCKSLTSLDLSGFDTSSNTDMGWMFNGCESLTSLDLSSLNTSSVLSMNGMFGDCTSLTSLDLSGWDTSGVTDMYEMFRGCSKLTSLDLSAFRTQNITDMFGMFNGCSSLASLDLSSFNTSSVTQMTGILGGCTALKEMQLGQGFSFVGNASLPSITANSTYTGKWTNGTVAYTSADLTANYDGSSMAGTWTWEKVKVKAASTVTLPAKTATYTGKKIAMTGAKVKGSAGKVAYTYYSDSKCKKKISASKVKGVGAYYVKATVAADANYKAATSKAAKLTVNPRPTALKSVKGYTVKDKGHYGNKGLKIKWAKPKSECAGVQFRVQAYDKKSAKWKTVQSEKAPRASYPTGCTVGKKSLKAKTAYQVQVRTYKKVSGKYYYSTWSKAKTAKTPK